MKLRIAVAVRRYGDEVFIAQTLAFPLVSAADSSREQALTKLSRSIVYVLEHLHPRLLSQLPQPVEILWSRMTLGIQADSPQNGKESETTGSLDVDVVGRRFAGGLMHIQIPLYHLDTWFIEEKKDEETWSGDGVMFLMEQMKSSRGAMMGRRAVPDEFEATAVEVNVRTMDLARVEEEYRWQDYFDVDDLSDGAGSASMATPTLEDVAQLWAGSKAGRDVVGRRFGPVYCRDQELEELVRHVEGKIPAAVVLVGPARVGKTAMVRAYGRWLLDFEAQRNLWFADSPRLCATDPMSPGWQLQAREVMRELEASGDVLYMGRLVEALDAGKYMGSDYNLAQFLKSHLAEQRVRIVAEATVEEWNQIERRDVGFARTFTVMRLADPEPEIGLEIVRRESTRRATKEGVVFGAQALERAWSLQRRFATEGSPVGRTIDFVGRTLTRAVQDQQPEISVTQIVEGFCEETGMPPVLLLDDRTLDLEAVRQRLSKRVMGQPTAVARVADVVGVTKAGLAADDRPLGSFLFVGSTGVGKTELARALSEFLFGSESRLVRLDMSEYASADGYQRLIGQGPGDEGDLTGPVRRQPFSVVLLDEIEKAHSSVFDLLLQVLGEARLTDGAGRMTRFQNAILIMTSNLGVETLRPTMGFSDSDKVDVSYVSHFRREAERFFRAEFLGRIDQFIAFSPLDAATVKAVAERELAGLHLRDGLVSRDMQLVFGPEVAEWVAKKGWDPRYGARPIKRAIEREIVWPLANKLAEWEQTGQNSGVIRVGVSEAVAGEEGRLNWEFSEHSGQGDSANRSRLLAQLDEVAGLWRRLRQIQYADVFTELEWKLGQYEVSSLSEHFWKLPEAAGLAQDADLAQKVVAPVLEIERELATLEDFATEAYHSQTFDIAADLEARVSEIGTRIDDVFLTVMRSAYDEPDQVVMYMPARNPQDPWRAKLLDWYGLLCKQRGWTMRIWRSLGRDERPEVKDMSGTWRDGWVETKEARGQILAVEIKGKGARPLLQGEDGLHRLLASDGSQAIDVSVPREDADSLVPGGPLEVARASSQVVRTWNLRTREVTVGGLDPIEFDVEDPWELVGILMEDMAWLLLESDFGSFE